MPINNNNIDLNSVEILLVDDNKNDAELTIRELDKNNMADNLFHVQNGAEALDFIFGRGKYTGIKNGVHKLKLILLDIKMPKVNGIEVLERLKSHKLTKSTKVVMLTSSKEDSDIQKCYALGVNSYIVKPVHFEKFAHAIRNLGFYWLLINKPH